MLLSFALWIQATPFFTYLRGSTYSYPSILALHMVVLAFFGGMILMTDMRLLGWALRKRRVSDVIDQLRVPKRYGLLCMVILGFLMFGCKAEEYYYNIFFRLKLMFLALAAIHALVFRRGVFDNAAELDKLKRMPGRAKLAAGLSLAIWTGVAIAGRGIGYIEPPFGIHAEFFHSIATWGAFYR
jgi:uncharacterized protein DUF6644